MAHQQHFAIETEVQAPETLPVWSGQAFSTLEQSARFCPNVVQNPEFSVFTQGRSVVFKTVGWATKGSPLPPGPTGAPRAMYSPPSGTFLDTRFEYEASGGDLVGECNVWLVRYTGTGMQVMGGWMNWTYYPNTLIKLREGGGGPDGGGFGGWAYKDDMLSVENGADDGWMLALGNWIGGGSCTPGWDIYVNGVHVCSSKEAL